MNYVNLIRKIRACEGEVAAQLLLEQWVSKFTYVVGLDIGKEQDQATVVVCCKHFPEGASHVVFAKDLTASKGQLHAMDPEALTAAYMSGFHDGKKAQSKIKKHVSYSGNGSAGIENMTAPTGFFFQMPEVEKQGPDYERGFIDGMQKQMQSSVDRAVNAMTKKWVGLTDEEVRQIRDDKTLDIRSHLDFYKHCEAKLKEKNT